MSNSPMAAIVSLGIYSVKLPHALREVAVGSLYDEMIVVVHEAVAMTDPVISLIDTGKGIKEREPVFITPKDRLAGIPREVM